MPPKKAPAKKKGGDSNENGGEMVRGRLPDMFFAVFDETPSRLLLTKQGCRDYSEDVHVNLPVPSSATRYDAIEVLI